MRDAMGGSVVIVIIVVFIVIALGYLAFNVNYTKAFRMKNKVISLYEEYKGYCNSDCTTKIANYGKEIGYTLGDLNCPSGFIKGNNYYCVKETQVINNYYGNTNDNLLNIKCKGNKNDCNTDIKKKRYFTIVTKINVELPIINTVMPFKFFELSGDTSVFEY